MAQPMATGAEPVPGTAAPRVLVVSGSVGAPCDRKRLGSIIVVAPVAGAAPYLVAPDSLAPPVRKATGEPSA